MGNSAESGILEAVGQSQMLAMLPAGVRPHPSAELELVSTRARASSS